MGMETRPNDRKPFQLAAIYALSFAERTSMVKLALWTGNERCRPDTKSTGEYKANMAAPGDGALLPHRIRQLSHIALCRSFQLGTNHVGRESGAEQAAVKRGDLALVERAAR